MLNSLVVVECSDTVTLKNLVSAIACMAVAVFQSVVVSVPVKLRVLVSTFPTCIVAVWVAVWLSVLVAGSLGCKVAV